jgi:hypothetical protein
MLHEPRRIGFGATGVHTAGRITTLGRIVEEPFLDEVPVSTGSVRVAESSSAFDLFPDENLQDDPTSRNASENGGLRLVERVDNVPDNSVPSGDVDKLRSRPSLLMLFFVVAALAAFGTVRACQVGGASSLAVWQLLGR